MKAQKADEENKDRHPFSRKMQAKVGRGPPTSVMTMKSKHPNPMSPWMSKIHAREPWKKGTQEEEKEDPVLLGELLRLASAAAPFQSVSPSRPSPSVSLATPWEYRPADELPSLASGRRGKKREEKGKGEIAEGRQSSLSSSSLLLSHETKQGSSVGTGFPRRTLPSWPSSSTSSRGSSASPSPIPPTLWNNEDPPLSSRLPGELPPSTFSSSFSPSYHAEGEESKGSAEAPLLGMIVTREGKKKKIVSEPAAEEERRRGTAVVVESTMLQETKGRTAGATIPETALPPQGQNGSQPSEEEERQALLDALEQCEALSEASTISEEDLTLLALPFTGNSSFEEQAHNSSASVARREREGENGAPKDASSGLSLSDPALPEQHGPVSSSHGMPDASRILELAEAITQHQQIRRTPALPSIHGSPAYERRRGARRRGEGETWSGSSRAPADHLYLHVHTSIRYKLLATRMWLGVPTCVAMAPVLPPCDGAAAMRCDTHPTAAASLSPSAAPRRIAEVLAIAVGMSGGVIALYNIQWELVGLLTTVSSAQRRQWEHQQQAPMKGAHLKKVPVTSSSSKKRKRICRNTSKKNPHPSSATHTDPETASPLSHSKRKRHSMGVSLLSISANREVIASHMGRGLKMWSLADAEVMSFLPPSAQKGDPTESSSSPTATTTTSMVNLPTLCSGTGFSSLVVPTSACCYSSFPRPLFQKPLRSLQHLFGMPHALLALEEGTGEVSVVSLVPAWGGFSTRLLRHCLVPGSLPHPTTAVDTLPYPTLSFFGRSSSFSSGTSPLSNPTTTAPAGRMTSGEDGNAEREEGIRSAAWMERKSWNTSDGILPSSSKATTTTTTEGILRLWRDQDTPENGTATRGGTSTTTTEVSSGPAWSRSHLIVAANMQEVYLFRCEAPLFSTSLFSSLFALLQITSTPIGSWALPHLSANVPPLVHFLAWRIESISTHTERRKGSTSAAVRESGKRMASSQGRSSAAPSLRSLRPEAYDEGHIRVAVSTEDALYLLQVTPPSANGGSPEENPSRAGGHGEDLPSVSDVLSHLYVPPLQSCFGIPWQRASSSTRIIGMWGVGGSASNVVVLDLQSVGHRPTTSLQRSTMVTEDNGATSGSGGDGAPDETNTRSLSLSMDRSCPHGSMGRASFTLTLVDAVDGVIMEQHVLPYTGIGGGMGGEPFPPPLLLGPRVAHQMLSSMTGTGGKNIMKRDGRGSFSSFSSLLFGRSTKWRNGHRVLAKLRNGVVPPSSPPPLPSRMGVLVLMKDLFGISAVLLTWRDRLEKWMQHHHYDAALQFIRDVLLGVEHSVHGWSPGPSEKEWKRRRRRGDKALQEKKKNAATARSGSESRPRSSSAFLTEEGEMDSLYQELLVYFEVVCLRYVEKALRQPRVALKTWATHLYDVMWSIVSYCRESRMQFVFWHRVLAYLREQYPLRTLWRCVLRAVEQGVVSGIISTVPTAYVPALVESLLYREDWEKEDLNVDEEAEKEQEKRHYFHLSRGGGSIETERDLLGVEQKADPLREGADASCETWGSSLSMVPLHSPHVVVAFPTAAARARAETVLLPLRGDLHALYQLGRQYHLRRLTLHIMVFYWRQYAQALHLSLLEDEWDQQYREQAVAATMEQSTGSLHSGLPIPFNRSPSEGNKTRLVSSYWLSPSPNTSHLESSKRPYAISITAHARLFKAHDTPKEGHRKTPQEVKKASAPPPHPFSPPSFSLFHPSAERSSSLLGSSSLPLPSTYRVATPISTTLDFLSQLFQGGTFSPGKMLTPMERWKAQQTILMQLYHTSALPSSSSMWRTFFSSPLHVLLWLHPVKATRMLLSAVCRGALEAEEYAASGKAPSLPFHVHPSPVVENHREKSGTGDPPHPQAARQKEKKDGTSKEKELDPTAASSSPSPPPPPAEAHGSPSSPSTRAADTLRPGLFAARLFLHLLFFTNLHEGMNMTTEEEKAIRQAQWEGSLQRLLPPKQEEEAAGGEPIPPLSPMEVSLLQPSQFTPLLYKLVCQWNHVYQWRRDGPTTHPTPLKQDARLPAVRSGSSPSWEGWYEEGEGKKAGHDGREGTLKDALTCFSLQLLQHYASLSREKALECAVHLSSCLPTSRAAPHASSTDGHSLGNETEVKQWCCVETFLPVLVQLTIFLYQQEPNRFVRRALEEGLALYFRSPFLQDVELRLWQRKCEAAGLFRSAAAIAFRDGQYGDGIDYYLRSCHHGPPGSVYEEEASEEEDEEEDSMEAIEDVKEEEGASPVKTESQEGRKELGLDEREEGLMTTEGVEKSQEEDGWEPSDGYGRPRRRERNHPSALEVDRESGKELFEMLHKEMVMLSWCSPQPKRRSDQKKRDRSKAPPQANHSESKEEEEENTAAVQKEKEEKKRRMDALCVAVIDRVSTLGRLNQAALVSFYLQNLAQKEKKLMAALAGPQNEKRNSSRKLLRFLDHLIRSREDAVQGNASIQTQYIELMCLHTPARVYPYLRAHQGSITYDHSVVLQCCRAYHLFSVTIFLLVVSHHFHEALTFTCSIVKKLLGRARRSIFESAMFHPCNDTAWAPSEGAPHSPKQQEWERDSTRDEFLFSPPRKGKRSGCSSGATMRHPRGRPWLALYASLRSSSSSCMGGFLASHLHCMAQHPELFEVLELGIQIGRSLNVEEVWLLLIDLFHLPEGFYSPSPPRSTSAVSSSSIDSHTEEIKAEEEEGEKRKRQRHQKFYELCNAGLAVVILGLSSSLGSASLFRQLLVKKSPSFYSSSSWLPRPPLSRWCSSLPHLLFLLQQEVSLYKEANAIAERDGSKWGNAYLLHSRRGIRCGSERGGGGPPRRGNQKKEGMGAEPASGRSGSTSSVAKCDEEDGESAGCGICHQPLGKLHVVANLGPRGIARKENRMVYVYSCSHVFHQVCLALHAQRGNGEGDRKEDGTWWKGGDLHHMVGPSRVRCPVCVGTLTQGSEAHLQHTDIFLSENGPSLLGQEDHKTDASTQKKRTEGKAMTPPLLTAEQGRSASGRALVIPAKNNATLRSSYPDESHGFSWIQYYAGVKKVRDVLDQSGDRRSGLRNILCSLPPPEKVREDHHRYSRAQ